MPDQLPSAILDGVNSYDSIFALELDTKQRFDNILNNQQKPIDYPIPDYNKDFAPQGLPQDQLMDPQFTKGTIGEAMFSTDPRVASYAVDKMRQQQSALAVNQGVGVHDFFRYSKEMDKYLNGDYGYNPYMSIEDNEDFNYRYDYLSQGLAERIFKNVGVGVSRFVGSVVLKLGQTLGHVGSMVWNGVEEIFDPKGNNFMADVADNSLSRWFEGLETGMKNSQLLSVFKPRGWEDMGFFQKLGNGAFWTDEIADGAAFMGEMVASMYLLGGLGKIGAVGRLGQTEINLTKALSKLGPIGRTAGKGLDFALKTATGADNLSGVGRWAFATASESAFEASGLYKSKKESLEADRRAGKNNLTDEEIRLEAGDAAAASFKANMLVLSASNAFENRFIFSPLFKKFGARNPNPRGRLISVSESTENLDELAKASRKQYNYKTWLGKKLDWKNSNSRLRFYGSRGLSATAAEGFWEENAQLAVERLASADKLTLTSFANQLARQTKGAITGDDPEASTSIGLGALIGIGGTSIVSKVAGGNRRWQGERRKLEEDTQKAIGVYEQFRRGFLNYQDVYERDRTGKPVMDSEGNLKVDPVKMTAVLEGTAQFASKLNAADKVDDPLLRKHIQDIAMADYVVAAKMAGIYDKAVKRFENLKNIDGASLENLGFDPNTTVDAGYLKDSLIEFGKIYEEIRKSVVKRGKNDTAADDENRKHELYKASTGAYSAGKLINEYQSKMMDRDFPSVFSPEAEGSSSEVQAYNSLLHQEDGLEQFAAMAEENGDFYNDYIRAERNRIKTEKARILAALTLKEEQNQLFSEEKTSQFETIYEANRADKYRGAIRLQPGLAMDDRGFLYSPQKYEGYSKGEVSMMLDQEADAQRKHAQYTNIRAKHQYLVNKFSNPLDGIKNYKGYNDYIEEIQKKDAAADPQTEVEPVEQAETQATPSVTPSVTPVQTPDTSITKEQAIKAEKIITTLTTLLANGRAVFILKNEDERPDYDTILNFIEEHEEGYNKIITDTLLNFAKSSGDVILDMIQKGTLRPDNIQIRTYQDTADFLDNLMEEGMAEDKVNPIVDYLNGVEAAMKNFTIPEVELTDAEQNAIRVLNQKDYSNTAIAPYTNIIADPNKSNADKREALKGLSDQMLHANTALTVGEILGRDGVVIDELGYEAPPELKVEEDTSKDTSKIEQLLALSAQQQQEQAKLFEPAGAYLVSQEPDGKWKLYNQQQESLGLVYDTKEAAIADALKPASTEYRDTQGVEFKVGDKVVVNTKKDGESTIKELRGDKALLEDGRQVKIENLIPASIFIDPDQKYEETINALGDEELTPEQEAEIKLLSGATQAETATADTEGSNSGIEGPPPPPKLPPPAPANTEEEFNESNNYIDRMVDESKLNGLFTYPQVIPAEVIMEGNTAKVTNGAVQLKTQTEPLLLRQHNITKQMGNKQNPVNFWSEDQNGERLFKIRLEMAGDAKAAKYEKYVYQTGKGLINQKTGKPNAFPFIVAMVIDQQGNYVNFSDEGLPGIGKPFGFVYTVEDYFPNTLDISRRGVQLKTGEPLNGENGFLSDNPLQDLTNALRAGVEITGNINEVSSGKLSAYNVDNSGATWAKEPKMRTVRQMMEDGDLQEPLFQIESSGIVELLGVNPTMTSNTETGGTQTQFIKVGQPYVFDSKSGVKIPLRGKLIKDLTINGKPLVQGPLKDAIEELQSYKGKGRHQIKLEDEEPTAEQLEKFKSLFLFLRTLIYSKNTPIFLSEDGTTITMYDQRPENIPLMDTEVNYSHNLTGLVNPFGEEEWNYQDFVEENFMSGALPAQLTEGQKSFEKLNRRIIFTLEKSHKDILDSVGAKAPVKTVRVKATDLSKFVGKTYGRKGGRGSSTITVTAFKDGKVTIKGPSGEVTKSANDFMKDLGNLEEITLPAATEEVKEEMQKDVSLSKEDIERLNEQAKNMTDEDVDNLDFGC